MKFKEKYDFLISDETILHSIFDMLYPYLNYNLFVVGLYSFEKQEKVVYFDIKDIKDASYVLGIEIHCNKGKKLLGLS